MSTLDIALGVAGIPVVICGVLTLLKGHYFWFFMGWLFFGLIWIGSVFLVAQPRSLWARWFYDEAQIAEARQRHPGPQWRRRTT